MAEAWYRESGVVGRGRPTSRLVEAEAWRRPSQSAANHKIPEVTGNFDAAQKLPWTTLLSPSPFDSTVHSFFNDCSDQCTPGPQPDLSLRLGSQIQTLLSREGRRTSGGRTGKSRSRSGCSVVRGGHVGSHTSTKGPDGPALEGDHFSWLHPAHADATQGRWQLSSGLANPLYVIDRQLQPLRERATSRRIPHCVQQVPAQPAG
jgi:hypothetical protein